MTESSASSVMGVDAERLGVHSARQSRKNTFANRQRRARAATVLAVVACGFGLGSAGTAAADDQQPIPGTPIVRESSMGIVNAGPSDVRTAKRKEPLGGVQAATDGGGLIKDGSQYVPGAVGNNTLCGTDAMNKGNQGRKSSVIDCGSDFIPYN